MTFPEPFEWIFSGDLHWSLDLLDYFESERNIFAEEAEDRAADDPEFYMAWQNKLLFYEVGNGDYIAVDLDTKSYELIVYLTHDRDNGHGAVLANDFNDFLFKWIQLACLGGDYYQLQPFLFDSVNGIDLNSDNARNRKQHLIKTD